MEKALQLLLQLILSRMNEFKEAYSNAAIEYTFTNESIHKCHFLLYKLAYDILNNMKNNIHTEEITQYFTFIKEDVSDQFYKTEEFNQFLSTVIKAYCVSNIKEMIP